VAAPKPITIVGGGLAGLTLGIGLRQRGIPVTVWEAGNYPRHRVCGEFISGRGQDVLARLGLRDSFIESGAVLGHTAAFYLGQFGSPVRTLTTPALCLSRYAMDALLAGHLRQAGGEVCENARWREEDYGEGVVRANGRRLQPREDSGQWFGLKVHAHNVLLAADLEMHGSQTGYVGFCRLKDGGVNVCGLFRRPAGQDRDAAAPASGRRTPLEWFKPYPCSESKGSPSPQPSPPGERAGVRAEPISNCIITAKPATGQRSDLSALRELSAPGTPLWERLEGAVFDQGSFCSVAGISLRPHRAVSHEACCIGDALTMIPPVTGNGMSMAFEAAELAIEPLAAYSHGESSWIEAWRCVAEACDQAFARRLAWARVLQWLMLMPLLRGWAGSAALHSDLLWRTMFTHTR
jgi:menaquinone-9 beta-reductase